jgi:Transposase DDE domain group 1
LVQAEFTAERVSSDGEAVLLREADRKINLLGRLVSCFIDGRSPLPVRHRLSELLAQRIYGVALGYENLNGYEHLHSDPLLGLLARNRRLRRIIGAEMHEAQILHKSCSKAARGFATFSCRTRKSRLRGRHVVAKAEHLA